MSRVRQRTLKCPYQGFRVECLLGRAGSTVGGDCALGEAIDKVAYYEILAGEVLESEAGASREKRARAGAVPLCRGIK